MVMMADWWSVGCEFKPHNGLFNFEFFVIQLGDLDSK